jgi:hypothetical protein
MCSPLDAAQLNLFADTYKPIPIRILTLAEALDQIQTGVYAEQIRYVRRMLTRGEHSYRAAKNRLPAFTFAGTFTPSRAIPNLQQHTGIALGDLDHLDDVPAVKKVICGDSRTVFVFDSPSATGLKVGVHIPIVVDDTSYKYAWETVSTDYQRLYGGTWDLSGKDVSRLCYVSHDPELYVNLDAEVFDVPPAPPPPPPPTLPRYEHPYVPLDDQDYGAQAIRTAVDMIQSAQPGGRHHARLRASRLLGGYVGGGLLSYQEVLSALSNALQGYTDDMSGALKTVVDGLAYGEAYPITRAQKDTERQAWIEAHWPLTPRTHQAPVEHDPWAGRRTLPLKPYQGLRLGRTVRRG